MVWFKPPANIWRHFRNIPGSKILVHDVDVMNFILRCLKALYGLVHGPLLWQLTLLHFMEWEIGFQMSLHDENFLFVTDGWNLVAVCIIHVDDLLAASSPLFLK